MDKLGRNYYLEIEVPGSQSLILPHQLPGGASPATFTIEFDITRNTLTSANVCQIRIFNLSKNNRNKIRKDDMDQSDLRTVLLRAGYGNSLSTIFSGTISRASSVREGVNFITTIESFDGGFAFVNDHTSLTFLKGASQETMLKTLGSSLTNVSLGAVGKFPGSLSRGAAVSGNTTQLLAEMSGGAFFIDNGKVHILGNDEVIEGPIPTINAAAGLLGTPVIENLQVTFDMIFEPRLLVGQKILLESSTADQGRQGVQGFNGTYKVISVKHRGMISPAVCGDAITTVGLSQWVGALTIVPQ